MKKEDPYLSWFRQLRTIPKSRQMSLHGEWKGYVWPHGVTGVPKQIEINFKFDATDKIVRGRMSFISWVKSRGIIENDLVGGFLNETELEFIYRKKKDGVMGEGRLFFTLAPDAVKITGRVVGKSSHTGEQFYSELVLLKGEKPDLSSLSKLTVPAVFIGHGAADIWKKLQRYLEGFGYKVVTFESRPRAGMTIIDVITGMMGETSFAVLVMTAEDKTKSGTLRPRQNVVHELGICQTQFGVNRAIILREEGIEDFSNIHGITHIPFERDKLGKAFRSVKETIEREFSEK